MRFRQTRDTHTDIYSIVTLYSSKLIKLRSVTWRKRIANVSNKFSGKCLSRANTTFWRRKYVDSYNNMISCLPFKRCVATSDFSKSCMISCLDFKRFVATSDFSASFFKASFYKPKIIFHLNLQCLD